MKPQISFPPPLLHLSPFLTNHAISTKAALTTCRTKSWALCGIARIDLKLSIILYLVQHHIKKIPESKKNVNIEGQKMVRNNNYRLESRALQIHNNFLPGTPCCSTHRFGALKLHMSTAMATIPQHPESWLKRQGEASLGFGQSGQLVLGIIYRVAQNPGK